MPDRKLPVDGVILAGGKSTRWGGQDKGLIAWQGKPLALHLAKQLEPKVQRVMINANQNIATYQTLGYPVIQDFLPDFPGPLAGIAAALGQTKQPYLLSCPCDTLSLPEELVTRLYEAIGDADVAVAHDGNRLQPLFGLWRKRCLTSLTDYLMAGDRKVVLWLTQYCHHVVVSFASESEKGWNNLNTPEDLGLLADRVKDF